MSAVSIPSRKMPWQTKAQRGTVMAALAIKKEIVKARLIQIREDVGHPDKPGKPLTVEDAAAKAGVKYRTWQRWEAGESVPYARNLAAIADAFGFDVGEFYDDSGDKAKTPDLSRLANGDRVEQMLEGVEALLKQQNDLLARQSEMLERIERAIAREDSLRAETEKFARLAREVVEGRPEATGSESPRDPQPSEAEGSSARAAKAATPPPGRP